MGNGKFIQASGLSIRDIDGRQTRVSILLDINEVVGMSIAEEPEPEPDMAKNGSLQMAHVTFLLKGQKSPYVMYMLCRLAYSLENKILQESST